MDIFRQIRAMIWQNNTCAVCGRPQAGALLCPKCRQTLAGLANCEHCGVFIPQDRLAGHHCAPPANPAALLTCYPYATPLKERLFDLKYHNRPQIAAALGPLLAARWQQFADGTLHADAIVPIPLHHSRQAERGYNQSELLAKALARELHLPVWPNAVCRTHNTQALHSQTPTERHQTLRTAFAPGRSIAKVRGQNIILLDDIITTGATMQYTAQILLDAGAANVWGLAVGGHLVKDLGKEKSKRE